MILDFNIFFSNSHTVLFTQYYATLNTSYYVYNNQTLSPLL